MSFIKHIFGKETLGDIKKEDIDKLIEDEVEESQHLDYEQITRKPKFEGLAEHVSGLHACMQSCQALSFLYLLRQPISHSYG